MNNTQNYQDTENRILGNLLRCPLESKSLHQIARETGLSYVTVHKLIPRLLKRKLIKSERKGKANLISVDFEHAETDKLSSAMLYERSVFLKKHPRLALLAKESEEALAGKFYCLVLFGSYARGEARNDSDIDLFFIVPERNDAEHKEKISRVLRLYPLAHFKIVSAGDFAEMLDQRYTVGRSVFQQGIVLFGTEPYYSMVKAYVRDKGY